MMMFCFLAGCLTGVFAAWIVYKKKKKEKKENEAWENYRQGFYDEEQKRR